MKKTIKLQMVSLVLLSTGVWVYLLAQSVKGRLSFTRNFIPDFLWAMAFNFSLAPIFKELFGQKYLVATGTVCFLCGTLYEVFQCIGICKGYGDVVDVVVYFTATLLGCNLIKKYYIKEKKK